MKLLKKIFYKLFKDWKKITAVFVTGSLLFSIVAPPYAEASFISQRKETIDSNNSFNAQYFQYLQSLKNRAHLKNYKDKEVVESTSFILSLLKNKLSFLGPIEQGKTTYLLGSVRGDHSQVNFVMEFSFPMRGENELNNDLETSLNNLRLKSKAFDSGLIRLAILVEGWGRVGNPKLSLQSFRIATDLDYYRFRDIRGINELWRVGKSVGISLGILCFLSLPAFAKSSEGNGQLASMERILLITVTCIGIGIIIKAPLLLWLKSWWNKLNKKQQFIREVESSSNEDLLQNLTGENEAAVDLSLEILKKRDVSPLVSKEELKTDLDITTQKKKDFNVKVMELINRISWSYALNLGLFIFAIGAGIGFIGVGLFKLLPIPWWSPIPFLILSIILLPTAVGPYRHNLYKLFTDWKAFVIFSFSFSGLNFIYWHSVHKSYQRVFKNEGDFNLINLVVNGLLWFLDDLQKITKFLFKWNLELLPSYKSLGTTYESLYYLDPYTLGLAFVWSLIGTAIVFVFPFAFLSVLQFIREPALLLLKGEFKFDAEQEASARILWSKKLYLYLLYIPFSGLLASGVRSIIRKMFSLFPKIHSFYRSKLIKDRSNVPKQFFKLHALADKIDSKEQDQSNLERIAVKKDPVILFWSGWFWIIQYFKIGGEIIISILLSFLTIYTIGLFGLDVKNVLYFHFWSQLLPGVTVREANFIFIVLQGIFLPVINHTPAKLIMGAIFRFFSGRPSIPESDDFYAKLELEGKSVKLKELQNEEDFYEPQELNKHKGRTSKIRWYEVPSGERTLAVTTAMLNVIKTKVKNSIKGEFEEKYNKEKTREMVRSVMANFFRNYTNNFDKNGNITHVWLSNGLSSDIRDRKKIIGIEIEEFVRLRDELLPDFLKKKGISGKEEIDKFKETLVYVRRWGIAGKKMFSYHDLLLAARGRKRPFTYINPNLWRNEEAANDIERNPNEPLFLGLDDVLNKGGKEVLSNEITGSNTELISIKNNVYKGIRRLMAKKGLLKGIKEIHDSYYSENSTRKYKHVILFDVANFCGEGQMVRLISKCAFLYRIKRDPKLQSQYKSFFGKRFLVALKNTGMIQPQLEISNVGSWYHIMEDLARKILLWTTEDFQIAFGRSGFYGKGGILIDEYISRVILKGRITKKYLSHDTFEARLMRPYFDSKVTILEDLPPSLPTKMYQWIRWSCGDYLINYELFTHGTIAEKWIAAQALMGQMSVLAFALWLLVRLVGTSLGLLPLALPGLAYAVFSVSFLSNIVFGKFYGVFLILRDLLFGWVPLPFLYIRYQWVQKFSVEDENKFYEQKNREKRMIEITKNLFVKFPTNFMRQAISAFVELGLANMLLMNIIIYSWITVRAFLDNVKNKITGWKSQQTVDLEYADLSIASTALHSFNGTHIFFWVFWLGLIVPFFIVYFHFPEPNVVRISFPLFAAFSMGALGQTFLTAKPITSWWGILVAFISFATLIQLHLLFPSFPAQYVVGLANLSFLLTFATTHPTIKRWLTQESDKRIGAKFLEIKITKIPRSIWEKWGIGIFSIIAMVLGITSLTMSWEDYWTKEPTILAVVGIDFTMVGLIWLLAATIERKLDREMWTDIGEFSRRFWDFIYTNIKKSTAGFVLFFFALQTFLAAVTGCLRGPPSNLDLTEEERGVLWKTKKVYEQLFNFQKIYPIVDPYVHLPNFKTFLGEKGTTLQKLKGWPEEGVPLFVPLRREFSIPSLDILPFDKQTPLYEPKRNYLLTVGEPKEVYTPSALANQWENAFLARQIGENLQLKQFGSGVVNSGIGSTAALLKLSPQISILQSGLQVTTSLPDFARYKEYPWVSHWTQIPEFSVLAQLDQLSRLSGVDKETLIRYLRWDEIKEFWDKVPAASAVLPEVQYELLSYALFGVLSSLGEEPTLENLQKYLETDLERNKVWSKEFKDYPISLYRDPLTWNLKYTRDFLRIFLLVISKASFLPLPQVQMVTSAVQEYGTLPFLFLYSVNIEKEKGRSNQLTQFQLKENLTQDRLAVTLGVPYFNQHWGEDPSSREAIHRVFGPNRLKIGEVDKFELEWDKDLFTNHKDLNRNEQLKSEFTLGMKIWESTHPESHTLPSVEELTAINDIVNTVFEGILELDSSKLEILGLDAKKFNEALSREVRIKGLDENSLSSKDPSTKLLMANLWVHIYETRIARVVEKLLHQEEVSIKNKAVLEYVAKLRYPKLYEKNPLFWQWYVLIDYLETYREIEKGYEDFSNNHKEMNLPKLSKVNEDELLKSLFYFWQEAPSKFSHIYWKEPYTSEIFSTMAHISGRSAQKFLNDFSSKEVPFFPTLNAVVLLSPPREAEKIAHKEAIDKWGITLHGNLLREMAWIEVLQRTLSLAYDVKNGVQIDPLYYGEIWNEVLSYGKAEWPSYPWEEEGMSEPFVTRFFFELKEEGRLKHSIPKDAKIKRVRQLIQRYKNRFNRVVQILGAHGQDLETYKQVVNERFELIRWQRVSRAKVLSEKARTTNAIMALATLLESLEQQGIYDFSRLEQNGPYWLGRVWVELYSKLKLSYDNLYWEGEGNIDYFLLVQAIKNHTLGLRTENQTLSDLSARYINSIQKRFHLELSLANKLAGLNWRGSSWIDSWSKIAVEKQNLSLQEETISRFIEITNQRIEEKTNSHVQDPKSRAHNALISLATLIIAAKKEEPLITPRNLESEVQKLLKDQNRLSLYAAQLLDGWSEIYEKMTRINSGNKSKGFPWGEGGIVEFYLLTQRREGLNLSQLEKIYGPIWKEADFLIQNGFLYKIPESYVMEINKLSNKRNQARLEKFYQEKWDDDRFNISDKRVAQLNGILSLATVLVDVRTKYGKYGKPIDPIDLAHRLTILWNDFPVRYPNINWRDWDGFAESIAVASIPVKSVEEYAAIIPLKEVNDILPQFKEVVIPRIVLEALQKEMEKKTGQTPLSEVVHFQALLDGVSMAKIYGFDVTVPNILSLLEIRNSIQQLSGKYQFLGLKDNRGNLRMGKSEYWTAVAFEEIIHSHWNKVGIHIEAEKVIEEFRKVYLDPMDRIYKRIKRSYTPQELEIFKEAIITGSRRNRSQVSKEHGINESLLADEPMTDEDILAESALYEIRKARDVISRIQADYHLGKILINAQKWSLSLGIKDNGFKTQMNEEIFFKNYFDQYFAIYSKLKNYENNNSRISSLESRKSLKDILGDDSLTQDQKFEKLKDKRGELAAFTGQLLLLRYIASGYFIFDTDGSQLGLNELKDEVHSTLEKRSKFMLNHFLTNFVENFIQARTQIDSIPSISGWLDNVYKRNHVQGISLEFYLTLWKELKNLPKEQMEEIFNLAKEVSAEFREIQQDGNVSSKKRSNGFDPLEESGVSLSIALKQPLPQSKFNDWNKKEERRRARKVEPLMTWHYSYLLTRAYFLLYDVPLNMEKEEDKMFVQVYLPRYLLSVTKSEQLEDWMKYLIQAETLLERSEIENWAQRNIRSPVQIFEGSISKLSNKKTLNIFKTKNIYKQNSRQYEELIGELKLALDKKNQEGKNVDWIKETLRSTEEEYKNYRSIIEDSKTGLLALAKKISFVRKEAFKRQSAPKFLGILFLFLFIPWLLDRFLIPFFKWLISSLKSSHKPLISFAVFLPFIFTSMPVWAQSLSATGSLGNFSDEFAPFRSFLNENGLKEGAEWLDEKISGKVPQFFIADSKFNPKARDLVLQLLREGLLEKKEIYKGPIEFRPFLWYEPDPTKGIPVKLGVVTPKYRPINSNGQILSYWARGGNCFDFGMGNMKSFGNIFISKENRNRLIDLYRLTPQGGTNPQSLESLFSGIGQPWNLLEEKALIPGLPLSVVRWAFYGKKDVDSLEPKSITPDQSSTLKIALGMVPMDGEHWKSWKKIKLLDYDVLLTQDSRKFYFMAFPKELDPIVYKGKVSSDLVFESEQRPILAEFPSFKVGALPLLDFLKSPGDWVSRKLISPAPMVEQEGIGMILSHGGRGKVYAGEIDFSEEPVKEIQSLLDKADIFLREYDGAVDDLKQRKGESTKYAKFLIDTIHRTHLSAMDSRTLTELPYGDHIWPENVQHWSGNQWFGSDIGDWLTGLNYYYRKTKDSSVFSSIQKLFDWSVQEGATERGAIYMKKGYAMLFTPEIDANTGRRDLFIDNSLISVCINHLKLVIRRGYERIAGVTWGSIQLKIDGILSQVDDGSYRFELDPQTLPSTFSTNPNIQKEFNIARKFTSLDERIEVKENVQVRAGVPSAKIHYEVTNRGKTPFYLNDVQMIIGDHFDYGDGPNEIRLNRYGFSRSMDGLFIPVAFVMEGSAVFYGDSVDRTGRSRYPKGSWVNFTTEYKKLRQEGKARYLIIFGYDKAAIYYLPKDADGVELFNVLKTDSCPYAGWSKLRIQYKVNHMIENGEKYKSSPVYSYVFWCPLSSTDRNLIPDELEKLAPLWLKGQIKGTSNFLSLQTDYAYTGLISSWIETFRSALLNGDKRTAERARLQALKSIEFSLLKWEALKEDRTLMPSYGIMRYFGYHVPLFDWAYEQYKGKDEDKASTYLLALRLMADKILQLQVKDKEVPNYGGYQINEFSKAAGSNNLDDQGIKLWALRVAYDRMIALYKETDNPVYRRLAHSYKNSAKLFIQNWPRLSEPDFHFYGITKRFNLPDPKGLLPNGYRETDLDAQKTPYGHFTLLFGIKNWMDQPDIPQARYLVEKGLQYSILRNKLNPLGMGGMYYLRSIKENMVHFDTNMETNAAFLRAMMFQPKVGPMYRSKISSLDKAFDQLFTGTKFKSSELDHDAELRNLIDTLSKITGDKLEEVETPVQKYSKNEHKNKNGHRDTRIKEIFTHLALGVIPMVSLVLSQPAWAMSQTQSNIQHLFYNFDPSDLTILSHLTWYNYVELMVLSIIIAAILIVPHSRFINIGKKIEVRERRSKIFPPTPIQELGSKYFGAFSGLAQESQEKRKEIAQNYLHQLEYAFGSRLVYRWTDLNSLNSPKIYDSAKGLAPVAEFDRKQAFTYELPDKSFKFEKEKGKDSPISIYERTGSSSYSNIPGLKVKMEEVDGLFHHKESDTLIVTKAFWESKNSGDIFRTTKNVVVVEKNKIIFNRWEKIVIINPSEGMSIETGSMFSLDQVYSRVEQLQLKLFLEEHQIDTPEILAKLNDAHVDLRNMLILQLKNYFTAQTYLERQSYLATIYKLLTIPQTRLFLKEIKRGSLQENKIGLDFFFRKNLYRAEGKAKEYTSKNGKYKIEIDSFNNVIVKLIEKSGHEVKQDLYEDEEASISRIKNGEVLIFKGENEEEIFKKVLPNVWIVVVSKPKGRIREPIRIYEKGLFYVKNKDEVLELEQFAEDQTSKFQGDLFNSLEIFDLDLPNLWDIYMFPQMEISQAERSPLTQDTQSRVPQQKVFARSLTKEETVLVALGGKLRNILENIKVWLDLEEDKDRNSFKVLADLLDTESERFRWKEVPMTRLRKYDIGVIYSETTQPNSNLTPYHVFENEFEGLRASRSKKPQELEVKNKDGTITFYERKFFFVLDDGKTYLDIDRLSNSYGQIGLLSSLNSSYAQILDINIQQGFIDKSSINMEGIEAIKDLYLGRYILAATDHDVHCFDIKRGELSWEKEFSLHSVSSIQFVGEIRLGERIYLFVAEEGGKLLLYPYPEDENKRGPPLKLESENESFDKIEGRILASAISEKNSILAVAYEEESGSKINLYIPDSSNFSFQKSQTLLVPEGSVTALSFQFGLLHVLCSNGKIYVYKPILQFKNQYQLDESQTLFTSYRGTNLQGIEKLSALFIPGEDHKVRAFRYDNGSYDRNPIEIPIEGLENNEKIQSYLFVDIKNLILHMKDGQVFHFLYQEGAYKYQKILKIKVSNLLGVGERFVLADHSIDQDKNPAAFLSLYEYDFPVWSSFLKKLQDMMPMGLFEGRDGKIWSCNSIENSIRSYTPNGSGGYEEKSYGEFGKEEGQFNFPCGIAEDSKGEIWVVDRYNHRLQLLDLKNSQWKLVGREGQKSGEFHSPQGIAIGLNEKVWIADTGNDRIQFYDPKNREWSIIGKSGRSIGSFNSPSGIAVDRSGIVWVVDSGNHRIQTYDPQTKEWTILGRLGKGVGQFHYPTSIFIDRAGYVWITDTLNHRIQMYHPYRDNWHVPDLHIPWKYPMGFLYDSQNTLWYFSNTELHKTPLPIRFNELTYPDTEAASFSGDALEVKREERDESRGSSFGKWIIIEKEKNRVAPFYFPRGFLLDFQGRFWLTNPLQSQFGGYHPFTNQLKEVSLDERLGYPLSKVSGLAMDHEENIWLCDSGNNKIHVYDPKTNNLLEEGEKVSSVGHFKLPTSIAFDTYGSLWIVDSGNHCIKVYNPSTGNIRTIGELGDKSGEFKFPRGIVIDSNKWVWVTDSMNHRVQRHLISSPDNRWEVYDGFKSPLSISTDSHGNIWVFDFEYQSYWIYKKESLHWLRVPLYKLSKDRLPPSSSAMVLPNGKVRISTTDNNKFLELDVRKLLEEKAGIELAIEKFRSDQRYNETGAGVEIFRVTSGNTLEIRVEIDKSWSITFWSDESRKEEQFKMSWGKGLKIFQMNDLKLGGVIEDPLLNLDFKEKVLSIELNENLSRRMEEKGGYSPSSIKSYLGMQKLNWVIPMISPLNIEGKMEARIHNKYQYPSNTKKLLAGKTSTLTIEWRLYKFVSRNRLMDSLVELVDLVGPFAISMNRRITPVSPIQYTIKLNKKMYEKSGFSGESLSFKDFLEELWMKKINVKIRQERYLLASVESALWEAVLRIVLDRWFKEKILKWTHNIREFLKNPFANLFIGFVFFGTLTIALPVQAHALHHFYIHSGYSIPHYFSNMRGLSTTGSSPISKDFKNEINSIVRMSKPYKILNYSAQQNKSNLFVIPSFLRHLFLPAINELLRQGNGQKIIISTDESNLESIAEIEEDLRRTLGENWSDFVTVVKVPFVDGKFKSAQLMNALKKIGGDKNIILVGRKEFWGGIEEMMKQITVRILSIDFMKGSEIDRFIEQILKHSGMTEEMKQRMKSWNHPSNLIEKITSMNESIQSFKVSQ